MSSSVAQAMPTASRSSRARPGAAPVPRPRVSIRKAITAATGKAAIGRTAVKRPNSASVSAVQDIATSPAISAVPTAAIGFTLRE